MEKYAPPANSGVLWLWLTDKKARTHDNTGYPSKGNYLNYFIG
jgi:hypothetical protein